MKNTNLFNFQNGMIYALATLDYEFAKDIEPTRGGSDWFEYDDNTKLLIPINQDKWNVHDDLKYRIYNLNIGTQLDKNKICYYRDPEPNRSPIGWTMINNIIFHGYYGSGFRAELIPSNIVLGEVNKLYCKYNFSKWSYSYWHIYMYAIKTDNYGKIEVIRSVFSPLIENGDTSTHELEIDISDMERIDFIGFWGCDGQANITEIGVR